MERADDAEADFVGWYEAAAPRLLAAMAAMTSSPVAAEDITAEAFARAYARWPTVRPMPARDGWVYRVAVNLAIGGWRRHRTERRWLARQRPDATLPDEADPQLWAAVRALPPRARTALALRYVADLSQPEIAEVMGIAPGTVASTLHAARGALAAALRPDDEEVH